MKKIIIIILVLELIIIVNSKEIIKEFTFTFNLFINSIMPSLFFQILFTNILFNINNKKNNIYNYLLTIFSGYPNNAKIINDEYMIYCTNYINPLFFFCTVGSIYLNNIKLTITIYLSHVISNIILTFLLKNRFNNKINNDINSNLYSISLKNTLNTLSIVLGNLLVISLFICIFKKYNIINTYLIGILEFSRGLYELSKTNINSFYLGLFVLIIITFQSLSIHFQMICLNNKIKYIKFLLYRILNVLISILLYIIIYLLMYKI